MKYLLLDIGNTRIKSAMATDGKLTTWDGSAVDRALASVTGTLPKMQELCPGVEVELLDSHTHLPIKIGYRTPNTLGADRRAAACGAWAMGHGHPYLIIDAGTCITIDFLSKDGVFEGGAILPGIGMKFKALHTFTARLPLIEDNTESKIVCGKTTEESIVSGVVTATRYEVAGYIAHYRREHSDLKVVITGGDAGRLGIEEALVEPNLVLIGLNEICNTAI